jgi:hypothetical protein
MIAVVVRCEQLLRITEAKFECSSGMAILPFGKSPVAVLLRVLMDPGLMTDIFAAFVQDLCRDFCQHENSDMYEANKRNGIGFCSQYFSVVLLTQRAYTVLYPDSCCVIIMVCVMVCGAVCMVV